MCPAHLHINTRFEMQPYFKYLQTTVTMLFASQVLAKSNELTLAQNPDIFKTGRTVQNSTGSID